ncbi:hypothetical protein NUU61_004603 [Penicillium alfredii]|uniref:C2H2-type domain-containing protein n=1 Tax=Penicillium alfredii TaxID=1506179 RepID=A0A9W9FLF4_9EURO|nr:uncharacterized protein NUU61_004603 [Penicillium alfredii]KAJ5102381.1 hypothetical protein NUU61_004603 [Penicillium alfredii]
MDRTPDSVYRSSSTVPSLPEDAKSLKTTSAYSSPASTVASNGTGPSTGIGLGISNCGIETTLDHLRVCASSAPLSYHSNIPSPLGPAGTFYNCPVNAGDFSNRHCYGMCHSCSHAADCPLGFYDSRSMSLSPSYNSVYEFDVNQDVYSSQMPGLWAPTPCAGPTTSSDAIILTAGSEERRYWDQGMAYNACDSASMSTPPTVPYTPATLAEDTSNKGSSGKHSKAEQAVAHRHKFTTNESSKDPSNMTKKPQIASASGLECPFCGLTFTRRSNCKEHQKKHDPDFKKSFPCEECPRVFARGTDLRRHTETVHLGIRKHACYWCDRRFTRQDSLTKHLPDCEDRPAQNKSAQSTGFPSRNSLLAAPNLQKRPSKRRRSVLKH